MKPFAIAVAALFAFLTAAYPAYVYGHGKGSRHHGHHGVHSHHHGFHHHGFHNHHRHHFHGGLVLGLGPFYPYYSSPWAYRTAPPVVYIERSGEQPYWYYCASPKGYYPYVEECPAGGAW
jgi:hypothetical protein